MKLIPLTKGYFAKVDDEDFERLSKYKWLVVLSRTPGRMYATRTDRSGGIKRTVLMHREILGITEFDVDHRDGDALNNQRHNLRPATRSQNNMNCNIKKHSTKYKGVTFVPKSGTFRARIQVLSKPINIGHFKTPELAALAYDDAAVNYFGDYARTNQQMGVLSEV